jgi:hypothetical protein
MPNANQSDHKETLKYLPKHHRTKGLVKVQVETFKALEKRYVHEGRTIDPTFLEGTSIRQNFAAINFDCLLDIDEQICPRFVLEFYETVDLSTNESGKISLNFTTNQTPNFIDLKDLAIIFGVPNEGTCLYTDKWPISSLDSIERLHPYDNPLASKEKIKEHLFVRTPTTRKNRSGNIVVKDPFGMEVNELKPHFKKWEEILRANVIRSIGNRDHVNTCLCYMLYSISTGQPFNLAYYLAKRMADIPLVGTTALPYGMLLTRLFRAISPIPPNDKGMCLDYSLVPHIFIPLSDKRVFKTKGKRTRSPSPSSSSSDMSDGDNLPNSKLPPLDYLQELSVIKNSSEEFKQTKGIFKCFGRYLSKLNKKIDRL